MAPPAPPKCQRWVPRAAAFRPPPPQFLIFWDPSCIAPWPAAVRPREQRENCYCRNVREFFSPCCIRTPSSRYPAGWRAQRWDQHLNGSHLVHAAAGHRRRRRQERAARLLAIARAAAIRRTRRRAAALVHFGAYGYCANVCTGLRARAQPDSALLQRRQVSPPPLLLRQKRAPALIRGRSRHAGAGRGYQRQRPAVLSRQLSPPSAAASAALLTPPRSASRRHVPRSRSAAAGELALLALTPACVAAWLSAPLVRLLAT